MKKQIKISTPIKAFPKLDKQLESRVRKALYEFDLLNPNFDETLKESETIKIAIALSGGKDSLSLLLLLKAISNRGFPKFELHPIHVQGPYSCGAGVSIPFLKAICKKLSLPLHLCTDKQNLEKLKCYSCSRNRRQLIFKQAKNLGISLIAFGHHSDDNAQTLLLNILHKAEPCGMLPKVPMKHYGITIIRPLIYCEEKHLLAYSQNHNFSRIICQCLIGQNSKRKQVADQIKFLEKKFPNAGKNLAKASLSWSFKKALLP
jgi:tRNA 2-thiocytidine biosynthesis protein TtcA